MPWRSKAAAKTAEPASGSGNQQPLRVKLDPSLLNEGQEAAEAATLAALQSAYERSTGTMKERMQELTGGLDLNLPGMGG